MATPSDLIEGEHISPFNIGTAISLKGFTLKQAEPLIQGLKNRVNDPKKVMEDIIECTGGQPFLTQRLCDLVVNQEDYTPNLKKLVQENIIDNWDDPEQDQQEHLRTIRNRILRSEQAGLLLKVYSEILTQEKVSVKNTKEEGELQLSGLVVQKGSVLKVYNPIYASVFNKSWIDKELDKLRPYAENFQAWIKSGKKDDSRLLRGKALVEAHKWEAMNRLSENDRKFLSASDELERKEKDKVAELEIEREQRKAAEQSNRRILFGTIILGLTLLGTIWGVLELRKINTEMKTAQNISKLLGELQNEDKTEAANEVLQQVVNSLSSLEGHHLKQASLLAATSQAYLSLEKIEEAQKFIKESQNYFRQARIKAEASEQVNILIKYIQAQSLQFQAENELAKKEYLEAFNALQASQYDPYNPQISPRILTEDQVESVHLRLWDLSQKSPTQDNLKNKIEESLKSHYMARTNHYIKQLGSLLEQKDWKKADELTYQIIRYSGLTQNINEKEWSYDNVSCDVAKQIDQLWFERSGGQFGFRVQNQIYLETGNTIGDFNLEAYAKFKDKVGWTDKYYNELTWDKDSPQKSPKGHLPSQMLRNKKDGFPFFNCHLD